MSKEIRTHVGGACHPQPAGRAQCHAAQSWAWLRAGWHRLSTVSVFGVLLVAAGAAGAQTAVSSSQIRGVLPLVSSLPVHCMPGGLNDTIVLSTGPVIYTCTAPNTYTMIVGSSASSGLAVQSSGIAVTGSPVGTFNVVPGTGVTCIPQATSGVLTFQCDADTAYLAAKTTLQGPSNPQICTSSSASGAAYSAACATTLTGYAAKQTLFWYADVSNTSATPTLNIDTLGAVHLVAQSGGALTIGSIAAGALYRIWYDGANFRVVEAGLGGGGLTVTSNPGTCAVTGFGPGSTCVVSAFSGQNVGEVTITIPGAGPFWPGAGNDFMTLTWASQWAALPHCMWAAENGGQSGGDPSQLGTTNFQGNAVFWRVASSSTTSGSLASGSGSGFYSPSVMKLNYACF
jgi:hypothetical protein